MASETTRDWGVWLFWVAIATLLVAASPAEYSAHHPEWGLRFLIAGLVLGGLCIVAIATPPLLAWLSKISRYALGFLRRTSRAIARAFVGTGAFLLRPFVERIMRTERGSSWTAMRRKFSTRGFDYDILGVEGHRVANAQFVVFPDYGSESWSVGFALSDTPLALDLRDSPSQVLCTVVSENNSAPNLICCCDRDVWRGGFERSIPNKASFVFGLSTFTQAPGRLGLIVTVDDLTSREFDIPAEYGRYLILYAWAPEEFRVDFTQIHVNWVPE